MDLIWHAIFTVHILLVKWKYVSTSSGTSEWRWRAFLYSINIWNRSSLGLIWQTQWYSLKRYKSLFRVKPVQEYTQENSGFWREFMLKLKTHLTVIHNINKEFETNYEKNKLRVIWNNLIWIFFASLSSKLIERQLIYISFWKHFIYHWNLKG